MTGTVKSVLTRVLSEELGRQAQWLEDDKKMGFDITPRTKVIDELHKFMEENDIKVRDDYYFDAFHQYMHR